MSLSSLSAPGPAPTLEHLARLPGRDDRITHVEVLSPRQPVFGTWPEWAAPAVLEGYAARGVIRPWQHQVRAAEATYSGTHTVIATGTASGKSLAFTLPALSSVLTARGSRGERGATVLYLSPTKALAGDQLAGVLGLGTGVRAVTHDGDSTPEQRAWARDYGEYILTNPDMLHRSLLPAHERWSRFFSLLRYVVVDECHHYRGVFGAQVAQVLRRLRRIATKYGAEPTFVLASATIADPAATATRLTGLPMLPITQDASPRGRVEIALWQPPLTSLLGENGAPVRRSAIYETADLLTDLVIDGVRTLAFVRSRRGVEQVALTTAAQLGEVEPGLSCRVGGYRGGYLPEERRAIEADLRSGQLMGLAATNALELGIDIAGLDAVVLAGFPGTRSAMWQQIGRAGRDAQHALAVLVARDDPLDTYLVTHPEALFGQCVEAVVFDPDNPYVLGPQLCAAAAEAPLTEADLPLFGQRAEETVSKLTDAGLLRRRRAGWYWTDQRRACDLTDLRSTGGASVTLVDGETGRVVGTVDAGAAHGTAHPGAVYLHRGETWLVEQLDLDEDVATIVRRDPGYSTSARDTTEIRILNERAHRRWGDCRVSFGEVEVTHQVVSFLKRRHPGGEVLGEEPVDLPPRTLRTCAMWWTVPDHVLADWEIPADDLPGAAHAAEHCAIGLLPLFATCDRWDIGGVSTARHMDTGQLTVFVYDGHPGGAGFAERGFEAAIPWLAATLETIRACRCESGCPSCVQSPKCGNQNHPLDKQAGATLLAGLLRQAEEG